MADTRAPFPPINTPWYADKAVHAVLTFVGGLVANAIGRKFGVSLNVEEIISFAGVIATFIGAHKWKTATLTQALIERSAGL